MKKYIVLFLSALISLSTFAQSADDKVGGMMNNGQWFELRDFGSADRSGWYSTP